MRRCMLQTVHQPQLATETNNREVTFKHKQTDLKKYLHKSLFFTFLFLIQVVWPKSAQHSHCPVNRHHKNIQQPRETSKVGQVVHVANHSPDWETWAQCQNTSSHRPSSEPTSAKTAKLMYPCIIFLYQNQDNYLKESWHYQHTGRYQQSCFTTLAASLHAISSHNTLRKQEFIQL